MRHNPLSIISYPLSALVLAGFFLAPTLAEATAPTAITFRYQHHLFTLSLRDYPDWKVSSEKWTMNGQEIVPPAELRVDGDTIPPIPQDMIRSSSIVWNSASIERDLKDVIGSALVRPAGAVTIGRDDKKAVTFEGVGLPGRDIDMDLLTDLTVDALEQGITDIAIPVVETQPTVTVTDPGLKAEGIQEVVTVGESDFSNSPPGRLHNIGVGMARFNGHLIPAGTVFSFDDVLGRVDATTGYWKELVIKGDKTEPDYGGGLCQVSSTAYRGVWEYGFPILDRRNHSYIVNHYAPEGTDATVYPGNADMKFKNDSSGSLLIQTYKQGNLAYFIYYGTKDARTSQIIGPYLWDKVPPPPDRTEYSTDLAVGEKKKLGGRVPGIKALWYRITKKDGKELVEPVYSLYSARPLYYLIGVAGSGGTMPIF